MGERGHWRTDLLSAVAVYALTTVPVLVGLLSATANNPSDRAGPGSRLLDRCCHFDGNHFLTVARDGYRTPPASEQPSVAFFPGYPLIARVPARVTGLSLVAALLVTANVAFVAALALLSAYLRTRAPDDRAARFATLLLVGLCPVGFYFRMAYSESLFLALVALLMFGFARRWSVVLLAVIAGAATGVRAVGVAAGAALVVHILADAARGSVAKRLASAIAVTPLTVWGLLAFMAFQYAELGTPLAFVEAQRHWTRYEPSPDYLGPKWVRLALAEPIWNAYIPDSPRYWGDIDRHGIPFLGLAFWNPLFFVAAVGAVCVGWARGRLSPAEGALGLALLAIPYLSRADEMSMVSQARFATVVVPAFVVFGHLLSYQGRFIRWGAFALMAGLLGLWTALFALAWPLF